MFSVMQLTGDEDVVAEATSVSIRCAASCVPIQTPANFGTGEGALAVLTHVHWNVCTHMH
jgi:hypothetical protein